MIPPSCLLDAVLRAYNCDNLYRDRNQDSGALNTQGVKKFGSKVYHGALDFVHNVGPLVHDGAEITEALKGRDEAGLWARELE